MTTTHLKLPLTYSTKLLLDDVNQISSKIWQPQIYKMNYQGTWTSLALLSKKGDNDTFSQASAEQGLYETKVLQSCSYLKEVVEQFGSPIISARLLRLSAGSHIKPHRDFKLGYENNNFRVHIPIITNDQVEFILDGHLIKMKAGECWYTNVNFTHSVVNKGKEDRIHLVIDAERNNWSDQMFFSLAPKESFNLVDDSVDTKEQIIEELKKMNNPDIQETINQLEKELKELRS